MNKKKILKWFLRGILLTGSYMIGSVIGGAYKRHEEKILDVLSGPEGK